MADDECRRSGSCARGGVGADSTSDAIAARSKHPGCKQYLSTRVLEGVVQWHGTTYEKNRDGTWDRKACGSWRVFSVGRVDEDDGRARVGVRHDHQVGACGLCSRGRLRVGERVGAPRGARGGAPSAASGAALVLVAAAQARQVRETAAPAASASMVSAPRARPPRARGRRVGRVRGGGRRLGVEPTKMLLLLALEGLDLAPARHPRGVDGVQGAVAERRGGCPAGRSPRTSRLLYSGGSQAPPAKSLRGRGRVTVDRAAGGRRAATVVKNLAVDPSADRRLKNSPRRSGGRNLARGLNSRWRRPARTPCRRAGSVKWTLKVDHSSGPAFSRFGTAEGLVFSHDLGKGVCRPRSSGQNLNGPPRGATQR